MIARTMICATIFARDVAVIRTCALCLHLKNYMAHSFSISKNIQ